MNATTHSARSESGARRRLTLTPMGCPYCGEHDPGPVVHRPRYADTLLAEPDIEDFEGWIQPCSQCGVYVVNPRYPEAEFQHIYTRLSRKGSSDSIVKRLAALPMRFIIQRWHQPSPLIRLPVRLMGRALDPVLQTPFPPAPVGVGKNVLDVGCGDGFHLRCYAALGCGTYGTEIHPGYANLLERGPGRIQYWIDEFTQIDWANETGIPFFDLILFQSVFYRLSNPRASLSLAWKLLRPGGSIVRLEPYCPDDDSVRFMARFNFPQGFTFVRDLDIYRRTIQSIAPQAHVRYEILYGRSYKLATGKEWGPAAAVGDVVQRLAKSLVRTEPFFVRIVITKPLEPSAYSP